jgi:hypothetical protein
MDRHSNSADEQYRELSATARLAVALHCFAMFCKSHRLKHSEIDQFLDDLWEFPLIRSDRWSQWERNHPELVHTALGGDWPPGFTSILDEHAIRPDEFRKLIGSVVEIVFSAFYGAVDDSLTMTFLSQVTNVVRSLGVKLPSASSFSESLFSERSGWGSPITCEVRDKWRALDA